MLRIKNKRGQSVLEYITLTIFILSAFFIFQKYLSRGITGRLKSVGDSFGQGRIYDPNKSYECAYDYQYWNAWYDAVCYDATCEDACLRATASAAACTTCIQDCFEPRCSL